MTKMKSERAQKEEKILQFWQDNKIFSKTLSQSKGKKEFIFYDGPPFATGLPHAGSLLSSIIKDVIPRYKTMQGFHVRRRWGWDCHGLPIENMIEKELGIKDKLEIESKFGIEAFNEACRSSVLRYVREWKQYVDRVGRWVDYDNAYKTMDNTFIESVWHALSEINKKGLLYEGRKVLLYCPHCQTPIAKAEVAMDNSYKDVTEESVTVEFRIKGQENKSFLAWTTTPWTLPGNVALAVHPDIDYVEIEKKDMGDGELVRFVLAKARLETVFGNDDYKVVREMKGTELVGLEYEPLYRITDDSKAYHVYAADFVTTEDGTGIVHTAILYGEDDYQLGLRENLPQVPLLDEKGHFNNAAPELVRGQYFKKAEKAIKDDLEKRGLMFKRENHTHSYPHCHRCGTALVYNALTSWFINIQKVKDRMIKLNEKVNWVPEYLKHGRFLNIVENAPDWTISRNRYWASPLPIWKDASGKIYLIGSIDELKKHTKKSGNKYFVMRHGQAESNVKNILDLTGDPENHLTEKGKQEVEQIKGQEFDLVFCSPFLRARESAEIIGRDFVVDERLREIGQNEEGSSARRRMGDFIYDIENKYQNKKILVISHGEPIWWLERMTEGENAEKFIPNNRWIKTGEFRKLDFVPLPHNKNFELDLHRPYIDDIELISEDGEPLKRIPEVIDGWVESASMPFAEYHYPFENKKEFENRFPGDFVAEYIAQTRTWFYYMHTIATALFDNIAFKNVITTGNVVAADGSKMSKSKGNYTDPLVLIDSMGADAFRYYLMSSVVMQAEDMLFKDEEIKDVHNRLINILWNSFSFYELYADGKLETRNSKLETKHVLDRWILARLDQLIGEVTEAMEKYDMVRATRPIKDFVSDLSTWYIRRSRDRFKVRDQEALGTARHVFQEFSKLIAPVMPFIAEDIYRRLKGGKESVHLEDWPKAGSVDQKILENMEEARKIVSLALEARSKAGIKVRQPLAKLEIRTDALGSEYLEIIKDELNVKEVVVNNALEGDVCLDTTLTPKLEEEGRVRDAMRAVQDWRKERGLKPGETARYEVPEAEKEFFSKHAEEIKKATNIEF
ncbi:MAG: Isoleucine-tRNA ligase [Parcubacteria group bacterium GW2011_GWB1_49_7]|uniref:Isoleucine--tRNA ligase n=1 Tax=Candidatus Zambryskibacteria bacterium RIFCSPHIGHO2_01_FULL_46_25 TaxID=1802738 RepID=A0A1G2T0J7_9BACT|nr:MAG: Isoleucine-tRNA ligase [Parcubacteria group bacterium GW2011_GWA1_47_10]KKW09726.1 MAG: Isoleucine-tRNA ligase [Parcubacteria group bacterium GW2011_GWB1_49_7]OHA90816.1 MAG: hypothetical protein A2838_03385 [Candidatus Zambryskibacteria bacterium RIFCSPHIGHO2_01_FULL_46_25]